MKVPRASRLRLVAVALTVMANMAATLMATPGYACACGAMVTSRGAQTTMNHEVAPVHWDGDNDGNRPGDP
jgi:hypothetical protein